VEATSQPPLADLATVLDRPAEALTTLAPSGYVLVDGRRYEAFCRSGHAPKGALLRVVGVDNFRVIVNQS
jgi:membrane-bound serine protease (ClpP class)